jgi:hypothetical protein
MAPAVILVARIAEKSITIGALDSFEMGAVAESGMREGPQLLMTDAIAVDLQTPVGN